MTLDYRWRGHRAKGRPGHGEDGQPVQRERTVPFFGALDLVDRLEPKGLAGNLA